MLAVFAARSRVRVGISLALCVCLRGGLALDRPPQSLNDSPPPIPMLRLREVRRGQRARMVSIIRSIVERISERRISTSIHTRIRKTRIRGPRLRTLTDLMTRTHLSPLTPLVYQKRTTGRETESAAPALCV